MGFMSTNCFTVSPEDTEVIHCWARPGDRILLELGATGAIKRATENEMINAMEELSADLERAIKRARAGIDATQSGQRRHEIRMEMSFLSRLSAEAQSIAVSGRAAQADYWSSPERSWNGGAS